MNPPPGDPVRERIVAALARRVDALEGEAQARLRERLAHWRERPAPAPPPAAAPEAGTGLAALAALVDQLGRAPAAAPLKAVDAFGATWSRLRVDRRLREALAQVPAQAGPLNSSQVVHRALRELHTLAPAYLDALLRQVDTLLWLERSAGLGERAPGAAARDTPPGLRPLNAGATRRSQTRRP